MSTSLILGSSSPRRRELLSELGIPFDVEPADIDETPLPNETPYEMVLRLAKEKAQVIVDRHPGVWIVASDTTITIDGKIIGKPTDAEDAKATLKSLQGRTHQVMSGVCVQKDGDSTCDVVTTNVTFLPMTDQDIDEYVQTGEPLDRAGSYAIQGLAKKYIEKFEGSYSSVVGLPMERLTEMLKEKGII